MAVEVPRGRLTLMALACGVTVGNVYLCQPLLPRIARDFGLADGAVGLVPAATQVGYALGLLLIVPLSDRASPQRLVRGLLTLSALGLAAAALAPGFWLLAAASLVLALFTVVPQVLISLAPSMSAPEQRGRMVGTLVSGLVLGILLSRVASGVIAQAIGSWRAAFVAAALATAALLFVLPGCLPAERRAAAGERLSYPALLVSMPPLLRHRPLLQSLGVNIFAFAAFCTVWATLALHLQGAPFGMDTAAIGLFGLWGAPGALLAPFAGRLADRWGSTRVNLLGLAASSTALVLAGTLGNHSAIALVVALNLLDFGQQSGQVANQARIFRSNEHLSGRMNTLYMTGTFIGGALGSIAAGMVWSQWGWGGVCILGLGLLLTALSALGLTSTAPGLPKA